MRKVTMKMLRSVLSVMLALSMMLAPCTSAFATESKGEINYVSLGDSMTNGYGFTGYEQGKADFKLDPQKKYAGAYGNDAYPNLFEDYLETLGYEVNHSKLAVSATRAEDLNYLLGGREEPNDGWFGQVEDYSGLGAEELKVLYQGSIEEADVITMGIGNASFGAYLMQYVTGLMGVMGGSVSEKEKVDFVKAMDALEPEQKAVIEKAYNQMLDEVAKYDTQGMLNMTIPGTKATLKDVFDIAAYVGAGFILNYKGVLERIVALNPDVDVVLIGLMNTTYGMEVTGEGFDPIPVGDILDIMFGTLNVYIAGLPAVMQAAGQWTEADFYYAEQTNPDFIVQAFDDLADAEWPKDLDGLSGNIVRERTIASYNEALRPMIGLALKMNLPEVTLDEVANYVFDESGNDHYQATLEVNGVGSSFWDGKLFEAILDGKDPEQVVTSAIEKEISIAIYLAIEEALVKNVDTLEISLDGLMALTGDIFGALGPIPDAILPANNPGPYTIQTELVKWFTGSPTGNAMCKIFAMFKVGNGMSVHPTPKAHRELFEAIKCAYTAKDKTLENVQIALDKVAELLKEYGPDLAKDAYKYAEDKGYIADLEKAIKDLKSVIDAEIEHLKTDVYPELVNKLVNLEAELKALEEELAAKSAEFETMLKDLNTKLEGLKEELAAKKAELENAAADAKAEIEKAIAEIESMIKAVEKAIEDAKAVINEVKAQIATVKAEIAAVKEKIAEISGKVESLYEAAVEMEAAIKELIKVTKDGVNAEIENVTAIIQKVLDKADAAVVATQKALAAVTDLVDDIQTEVAAIVVEIAAVRDAVANVYNYYVDALRTLNANVQAGLTKLYEETLADLLATYETVVAEANAQINALNAELEAQIKAVKAEIEAKYAEQVAVLEGAIAKLEAEIAAKKAEVENAIKELDAEIRAKYAEQVAALEGKIAEIEAAIVAKKAELENAADDVKVAIEAEIKALEAELTAAKAELEALLAKIDAEVNAAVAKVNAEIKALEDKLAAAKAELEALLAKIDAEVNAAVANVKAEIEAKIAAIEAVIAEVEAAVAEAKAAVEALNANVEAKIAAIRASYERQVEALYAKVAKIEAEIAAKKAELENAIKAADAELKAAIEAEIKALEEELAAAKAELEGLLAKMDAEIAAAVKGFNAEVEAKITAIKEAHNKQVAALYAKVAEIEAAIAAKRAELENAIKAADAELKAAIEAEIKALEAELATVKAELKALLAKIDAEIAGAFDALEAKAEAGLEALKDALENAIEDLFDAADAKVKELLAALDNAVKDLVKDLYDATEAEVLKALAALNTKVEETLDAVDAAIIAKVEELNAAVKAQLVAAAEELQAAHDALREAYNKAYYGTVRGKYVLSENSYYVSIGDSAVTGIGSKAGEVVTAFPELLTEDLKELNAKFDYAQLGQDGLRVEDIRYILDETYEADEYSKTLGNLEDYRETFKEEIEKANLVTVGMGSNNFTTFTTAQIARILAGKETYEMDWSKYVTAAGVPYVEAALTEVRAKLAEEGLDKEIDLDLSGFAILIPDELKGFIGDSIKLNVADAFTKVIESYAYAYAGFAFNYPVVLNKIHEINPEALVTVVGGYNPLDGFNIDLLGQGEVSLGEYLDYFMTLVDFHYTAYAMLTPNTLYVTVPETETHFDVTNADEESVSIVEFLLAMIVNNGGAMYASAEGHKYIKDRISDALIVRSTSNEFWLESTEWKFTGEEIKPNVYTNFDFVEGVDYEVSYVDNKAPGTAKAVVTPLKDDVVGGELKFTIKVVENFTTNEKGNVVPDVENPVPEKDFDLSDARIEAMTGYAESFDQVYTGKALKPAVKVYHGTDLLVAGKDYTVSYKNNTKAFVFDEVDFAGMTEKQLKAVKIPTITIKGKGNYTGTQTIHFDILRKDLADVTYTYKDELMYSGKKLSTSFAMKNGTVSMKNKTDYTVEYFKDGVSVKEVKAAGEYTMVVTGKGNYEGALELPISVKTTADGYKALSKLKISTKSVPYGNDIADGVVVKDGKTVLTNGVDYVLEYDEEAAVNAGKHKVVVRGIDKYVGSKTVTVTVKGISLAKATVKGLVKSVVYTGEEFKPNGEDFEVTLKVKEGKTTVTKTLVENVDYVITYSSNVTNKGTVKLTFKGIGKYTGSFTKSFTVAAYKLADAIANDDIEIVVDDAVTFNRSGAKAGVKVLFKGEELVNGKDYTLSYSNTKKEFDYEEGMTSKQLKNAPKVVVKAKGNFSGSFTAYYDIVAKDFAELTVIAPNVYYANKKGNFKTTVTVLDENGKKLTSGKDYKVTYVDENGNAIDSKAKLDAGTAVTVKVTAVAGKGYAGEQTADIRILQAKLSNLKISKLSFWYTGEAIKLTDTKGKLVKDDSALSNALSIYIKTKVFPGIEELVYGEDFEIVDGTYAGNVKKGTASVTIKGIGNYAGTYKVTYKIVARPTWLNIYDKLVK